MKETNEGYYIDVYRNVAIITAKVVTRKLIKDIISYNLVREIEFADSVEEFEDRCFFHLNLDCFNFNTATNLKRIGESCFEGSVSLHGIESFENVSYLGGYAFADCACDDVLNLPNVFYIPKGCFAYADINKLTLINAKSMSNSAFKQSKIKHLSLNNKLKTRYCINMLKCGDTL